MRKAARKTPDRPTVASRGGSWSRLLARFGLGAIDPVHGQDFTTNLLHVDADTICPRCLSWIAPEDVVRRTAYGLIQHEACRIPLDSPDPASVC
jgi:hypothetical protein